MKRDDLLMWFAEQLQKEPVRLDGGYVFRQKLHVGEFAYLARVYDPVGVEDVNRCLIEFDKPENPYTRFLSESANGLRFANLSLYGLVRLINRSVGSGVGQPISLEYGNILERPSGLAESEMVIGGLVGWSSHGVYIIDNRGRVRLTRHTDSGEVAAEWDSLGDMVRAETARIVELLDERGEPLSSHTALMHPEGRRWETAREPLTSVH